VRGGGRRSPRQPASAQRLRRARSRYATLLRTIPYRHRVLTTRPSRRTYHTTSGTVPRGAQACRGVLPAGEGAPGGALRRPRHRGGRGPSCPGSLLPRPGGLCAVLLLLLPRPLHLSLPTRLQLRYSSYSCRCRRARTTHTCMRDTHDTHDTRHARHARHTRHARHPRHARHARHTTHARTRREREVFSSYSDPTLWWRPIGGWGGGGGRCVRAYAVRGFDGPVDSVEREAGADAGAHGQSGPARVPHGGGPPRPRHREVPPHRD
jgi:hypothetical protein